MYRYEELKQKLFTDDGQRTFLKARDFVEKAIAKSGAVQMEKVLDAVCGDTWLAIACVDRMVELGELREVTREVAGQHRVFVSN